MLTTYCEADKRNPVRKSRVLCVIDDSERIMNSKISAIF
jgi:hypothetical protein